MSVGKTTREREENLEDYCVQSFLKTLIFLRKQTCKKKKKTASKIKNKRGHAYNVF